MYTLNWIGMIVKNPIYPTKTAPHFSTYSVITPETPEYSQK